MPFGKLRMKEEPIINIAIADDHRLVRDGIVSLIDSMDFGGKVIIEADEGRDLLDKIAAAERMPDVCIIDISMNGMDGYDTMLELQKKYPFINGLALSQYDEELPILLMMKYGAKGYVSKIVKTDTFQKAILTVYSGSIFFPDDLLVKYPWFAKTPLEELTGHLPNENEMLFLKLCCNENLTYAQIADVMYLSSRTIENMALKLSERLNVKGRKGLILYAGRAGFTPPPQMIF